MDQWSVMFLRGLLLSFGSAGWMWSHGYDYHARERDRDYVMKHLMSASDSNAVNKLYAWGVKYVVTTAHVEPKIGETLLDGHIKRVFHSGAYHVFRVKYNNEPF